MRKLLRFLFWVALVVGIVIGVLRITAIRWWRVPHDDPYLTASVSPSLRPGDLIVLWRLTRPGFGDLVMCPEPGHPERSTIGRIVGEQRDELVVAGASITINRKRQTDEGNCTQRTFKERAPTSGAEVEQNCSLEELGGGLHMRGDVPSLVTTPPAEVKTTVPQGMVWLVSDNRLFPYDSRDFGPVPRETCSETVVFRLVGAGGFFDSSTRNQYIR
ncbi:MAG: signal peptidase I [Myxococcales bacterium]|nr:MAG: signal peptidase I [Myxococcales bacterium]